MVLKIEHISKKQKQLFKKLVSQINDQDMKLLEQNKEIYSLRTEELNIKPMLEKVNKHITELDSQLHKIDEEMQVYKSKSDTITQEVKNQSELILDLKENQNTNTVNTSIRFKEIISKVYNYF